MSAAATVDGVVVMSAGALLPAANSAAELWRLAAGEPPSSLPERLVPTTALHAAAGVAAKEVRKVDRFSLLALAAARRALMAGGVLPEQHAACGVITGNVFAGWTFTEPQLAALHDEGLEAVSPYLATAWFPAAPQGQITIQLGLQGFAKTITTDRCAGSQAIGLAYERIAAGRSGPLLAGGVEAPLTPLVTRAAGVWGPAASAICEGAAYLLLAPAPAAAEERAGATGRAARLRIAAYESHPLPGGPRWPRASWLASRLRRVAAAASGGAAGLTPRVTVLNFPLDERLVAVGRQALSAIWPGSGARALVTTPRLGDPLAASGAVAAIVAAEALAQPPASGGTALVVSLGHQCCDLLALRQDP